MSGSERRLVAAIVVSYFTGPLLPRAIASLRAQPEVSEIILVDNGNWPGAIDEAIAASEGAAVRTLTGHDNIGFAAACNLGAKAADGEYLLFLNPDAALAPGAVGRLLADGAKLKRPWMLAPKLVGPDGREQRGSRRRVLTPWRAFVEALQLWRIAPRHPYFRRFNLHDEPAPDEIAATPVLSGACFIIPYQDYWSIGGMDEAYFLHVEDIDFCLRFAKAGGGVYFDPFAEAVHAGSSSRADAIRIERKKTQSLIRYFRRHFAGAYPKPFLSVAVGLLWAAFALKALRRAIERGLALVGRGPLVAERARRIAARRRAR